jgi:hypothetical protein
MIMALSYDEYEQSLGTLNTNTPLAQRMMEHIPGITASIGFSSFRGSNTLIRGGFMDDPARFKKSRSKFGIFQKGEMTPTRATEKSFIFGRKRNIAGKDPFIKPSRLNNVTARPRALTRMHSLSVFTAGEAGSGIYTFAQGHRILNQLERSGKLKMGGLRSALGVEAGTPLFGAGMLSAVAAGSKLDKMTRKGRLSGAALDQLGLNVKRLATTNNPALMGTSFIDDALSTIRIGSAAGATTAQQAAARGVGGNLIASTIGGAGTQYFAGYFRGAKGMFRQAGLTGASKKGALKAVLDLQSAVNKTGVLGSRIGFKAAGDIAAGSVYKKFGISGLAKLGATKAGAKFLGARAAALAIPGLQFVAAASFIYDLGKMGGEIVKSGINLARDANRSLQGSMGKPLFGMGYRDSEMAATSRSRGVMAIQNSRLNARSVLGSEASMMAAHFG